MLSQASDLLTLFILNLNKPSGKSALDGFNCKITYLRDHTKRKISLNSLVAFLTTLSTSELILERLVSF